jgi:phage terminase large subunit-like protein
VVCWIDPAVSDSDDSDCMGIQIDALGVDKKVYRLYSWEDRASPEAVIRRAILKAQEYDAREVGFETDQGGILWRDEYYRVFDALVKERKVPGDWARPSFKSAKAGSIGSKRHRHNLQRTAYDRGIFVHVTGTHNILENALKRFPINKPYDLADASFWSWYSLTRFGGGWNKNY